MKGNRKRRIERLESVSMDTHGDGSNLKHLLHVFQIEELLRQLASPNLEYDRQRLPPGLTPQECREAEVILAQWDRDLEGILEEYGDVIRAH